MAVDQNSHVCLSTIRSTLKPLTRQCTLQLAIQPSLAENSSLQPQADFSPLSRSADESSFRIIAVVFGRQKIGPSTSCCWAWHAVLKTAAPRFTMTAPWRPRNHNCMFRVSTPCEDLDRPQTTLAAPIHYIWQSVNSALLHASNRSRVLSLR